MLSAGSWSPRLARLEDGISHDRRQLVVDAGNVLLALRAYAEVLAATELDRAVGVDARRPAVQEGHERGDELATEADPEGAVVAHVRPRSYTRVGASSVRRPPQRGQRAGAEG